jgi:uncharacterized protein YkwD
MNEAKTQTACSISTNVSKTILQVLVLCLVAAGSAFSQQYDEQAEQQLVQLLNTERARAGLPRLNVDDRLTQAARAHSTLMAEKNQLSHQFSGEPNLMKRLAATGLRLNNDAENLAYDYSAQEAHGGLMNSPLHRANILSPKYNTVGVGVVKRGDVIWVTEDFAHRLQEYSVNDAENAIIAAYERERRRAGEPPAQVVRMTQLRSMACAMARQGRLDSRAPLRLRDVEAAVVYTESDPAKLPPNAVKMAHDRTVKRFAVGACFARSPQYPAGVWWVTMAFL